MLLQWFASGVFVRNNARCLIPGTNNKTQQVSDLPTEQNSDVGQQFVKFPETKR